jgi:hypothetical protein
MTVFVVRCWFEPQLDGPDQWRASVYDPRYRQRRYFDDPHELSSFLSDVEPWPVDANSSAYDDDLLLPPSKTVP